MNFTRSFPPFTLSQIKLISSKRLIILDLDNTIYPETSWLFSAYASIAAFSGVPPSCQFMIDYFLSNGRNGIFQAVRQAFPAMKGSNSEWLEIMHNQSVLLTPFPWVKKFLEDFACIRQCIVTNGNPRQQLNKYKCILSSLPTPPPKLFCCNMWAPKPASDISQHLLHYYNLQPGDCIMIGDSLSDEEFAINSNFDFILLTNAG